MTSCGRWLHLSFILCSQFPFEGGEQSGQDDPQVACQSISCHRGQEGQDAGVDGGSGQLDVERGWRHSQIQVATVVRTQTVTTHLWDQVR